MPGLCKEGAKTNPGSPELKQNLALRNGANLVLFPIQKDLPGSTKLEREALCRAPRSISQIGFTLLGHCGHRVHVFERFRTQGACFWIVLGIGFAISDRFGHRVPVQVHSEYEISNFCTEALQRQAQTQKNRALQNSLNLVLLPIQKGLLDSANWSRGPSQSSQTNSTPGVVFTFSILFAYRVLVSRSLLCRSLVVQGIFAERVEEIVRFQGNGSPKRTSKVVFCK